MPSFMPAEPTTGKRRSSGVEDEDFFMSVLGGCKAKASKAKTFNSGQVGMTMLPTGINSGKPEAFMGLSFNKDVKPPEDIVFLGSDGTYPMVKVGPGLGLKNGDTYRFCGFVSTLVTNDLRQAFPSTWSKALANDVKIPPLSMGNEPYLKGYGLDASVGGFDTSCTMSPPTPDLAVFEANHKVLFNNKNTTIEAKLKARTNETAAFNQRLGSYALLVGNQQTDIPILKVTKVFHAENGKNAKITIRKEGVRHDVVVMVWADKCLGLFGVTSPSFLSTEFFEKRLFVMYIHPSTTKIMQATFPFSLYAAGQLPNGVANTSVDGAGLVPMKAPSLLKAFAALNAHFNVIAANERGEARKTSESQQVQYALDTGMILPVSSVTLVEGHQLLINVDVLKKRVSAAFANNEKIEHLAHRWATVDDDDFATMLTTVDGKIMEHGDSNAAQDELAKTAQAKMNHHNIGLYFMCMLVNPASSLAYHDPDGGLDMNKLGKWMAGNLIFVRNDGSGPSGVLPSSSDGAAEDGSDDDDALADM